MPTLLDYHMLLNSVKMTGVLNMGKPIAQILNKGDIYVLLPNRLTGLCR